MPSCTAGDWTIAAACRPPMSRNMMLLVLDIMEFAAAEGLCPPVKTTLQTPAANRQEVVILDTDALRRLETYLLAKPDITGTGILISLHTGLRIE